MPTRPRATSLIPSVTAAPPPVTSATPALATFSEELQHLLAQFD